MERRLNYTIVGSFVIVLAVCLVAFLFWMAKYSDKAKEFDYYYTYFQESVSGLNVESLVKLRGVEVGRVKAIKINKDNSEEVAVLLEIENGTPIKVDNYATLDTQGITGLKYIELKGGSNSARKLETDKKNIATIASKKSLMSTLFDNGESITNKIDNILNKIDILLSQKNVKNIDNLLSNLSSTSSYIDANKQKVFQAFEDISALKKSISTDMSLFTSEGRSFLEHSKKFEDDLLHSFKKLGVMSVKAGKASDATFKFFTSMQKNLENGQFDFANAIENNLQIINELALNLKDLSQNIDSTIKELEKVQVICSIKVDQKI